jgi:hypothetical protein
MKKRIHIFDEDIVEKRVRPYFEAQRSNWRIANMGTGNATEHGGTGYACFDFTVPYPEDNRFDGTALTQYFDETSRKSVYRRANHFEELSGSYPYARALNWVKARWLEHGVPGYWECKECGYSTMGEDDPAKRPEEHLAAHGARAELVPRIIDPPPPDPPLPIGTFYVTRLRPDSKEWVVCQISPKPYALGGIPWSGKKVSMHKTKEEAKKELMRRITKK